MSDDIIAECDSETSIDESRANSDCRISSSPKCAVGSKARSCSPPRTNGRGSKKPLASWEEYTKGIGSKLMLKMGYVAGSGLGRNRDGRVHIVEAKVAPKRVSLDNYSKLVDDEARKEARRIFRLTNQSNPNSAEDAKPQPLSIDWETFNPSIEQYEKAARILGMDHPSRLSKAKKRLLRLMMRSLIEKSLPDESNSKTLAKTSENISEITIEDGEEPKTEQKDEKNSKDDKNEQNGEKTPKNDETPIKRQKLRRQRRAACLFLDRLLDETLRLRRRDGGKSEHFGEMKEDSTDVIIVDERSPRKRRKMMDNRKRLNKRTRLGGSPAKRDSKIIPDMDDDRLYRIAIVDDVDPRGHVRTKDADDIMNGILRFLDKTAPRTAFDESGRDTPWTKRAPQFERCEMVRGRLEFDCVGWHTVDFMSLAVLSLDELWHKALFRLVDLTGTGGRSATPEPQTVKEVSVWLLGHQEETRLVLKRFHVQNPGLRPLMWQIRRKNKQPPRGQTIVFGVNENSWLTLQRSNMKAFYGLGMVEFTVADHRSSNHMPY